MTADLAIDPRPDAFRMFDARAYRTVLILVERVSVKPHVCLACEEPIPAPSVYVAATCGGKRTRFTAALHRACVPGEWGRVPPINPLTAWCAAKRAIRDARRPEDVPSWVADLLVPCPF